MLPRKTFLKSVKALKSRARARMGRVPSKQHVMGPVTGVRKRVVLADVPLHRVFLQSVFPCSAALAEESYDFSYSWTPKTGTRAHSPKPPFYKTALWFPLD